MSSANLSTLDYESLSGLLTTTILVYGAYKIVNLVLTYLERAHEKILASRRPARRGTLEMEQGVAGNPDTSGSTNCKSSTNFVSRQQVLGSTLAFTKAAAPTVVSCTSEIGAKVFGSRFFVYLSM